MVTTPFPFPNPRVTTPFPFPNPRVIIAQNPRNPCWHPLVRGCRVDFYAIRVGIPWCVDVAWIFMQFALASLGAWMSRGFLCNLPVYHYRCSKIHVNV